MTSKVRITEAPKKPAAIRAPRVAKPQVFSADSRELLDGVRDALVFAGTDETLPVLTGVVFHLRPGHLYLSATDRYCLGQVRLAVDSKVTADFMLLRPELARLNRYFRPTQRYAKPVMTMELTESGVTVADGDVRASLGKYTDVQWPPSDPLFDNVSLGEPYTAIYNAQFMGKFAKVVRGSDPMFVTPTGSRKPTFVTIGDYFRGLIMPVTSASTDTGKAWPVLAPKKAAPKARKAAS